MLLRESFGLWDAAALIESALADAWRQGWRTADLAGPGCRIVGTRAMADRVSQEVLRRAESGREHEARPAARRSATGFPGGARAPTARRHPGRANRPLAGRLPASPHPGPPYLDHDSSRSRPTAAALARRRTGGCASPGTGGTQPPDQAAALRRRGARAQDRLQRVCQR